jgi:hypothetical protein
LEALQAQRKYQEHVRRAASLALSSPHWPQNHGTCSHQGLLDLVVLSDIGELTLADATTQIRIAR